jgi:tRNA (guanosine-2'-O-)-methyltransferase
MTPARKAKIEKTLRQRLQNISFAFENPTDPHNVAAAVRTLEGLGIWHIQEICQNETHGAKISGRVAIGARKWVNYQQRTFSEFANDPGATIFDRRPELWVSYVPKDQAKLKMLPEWTPAVGPTVFVFGNEHAGVSDEMVQAADQVFAIPMYGMVESYNLSVSAAVCAWHVRSQLQDHPDPSWRLTDFQLEHFLKQYTEQ